MNPVLLAAVVLIVLHDVDGGEVSINPEHVVTLKPTKEGTGQAPHNELMAGGVKCVIGLVNGNRVSVIEICGMVRQAIRETQR